MVFSIMYETSDSDRCFDGRCTNLMVFYAGLAL